MNPNEQQVIPRLCMCCGIKEDVEHIIIIKTLGPVHHRYSIYACQEPVACATRYTEQRKVQVDGR